MTCSQCKGAGYSYDAPGPTPGVGANGGVDYYGIGRPTLPCPPCGGTGRITVPASLGALAYESEERQD